MSHLDELDEFEAELELRLKKEYADVFGLFRYCVLTQDATYLCNKLDLQYAPQASYPFFQIKMEDVWVWDKNRPTRIIPRAEVYTSSDVTVEELRGEGDEPSLTAEARAERSRGAQPDRRGACGAHRRVARLRRRPVLTPLASRAWHSWRSTSGTRRRSSGSSRARSCGRTGAWRRSATAAATSWARSTEASSTSTPWMGSRWLRPCRSCTGHTRTSPRT